MKKVKDTNLKSRSIGLGVMGEAQMLAEHKVMFGSRNWVKDPVTIKNMIARVPV